MVTIADIAVKQMNGNAQIPCRHIKQITAWRKLSKICEAIWELDFVHIKQFKKQTKSLCYNF
jgi:hypothetical protein